LIPLPSKVSNTFGVGTGVSVEAGVSVAVGRSDSLMAGAGVVACPAIEGAGLAPGAASGVLPILLMAISAKSATTATTRIRVRDTPRLRWRHRWEWQGGGQYVRAAQGSAGAD